MSEPTALAVARRAPHSAGIRISGPLDMIALDHIRAALDAADGAPFVIRCEQVTAIDPAAAACLWRFCADLERSGIGRLWLAGLPGRFAHRLRLHPLMRFAQPDDEIFADPFERVVPSAR